MCVIYFKKGGIFIKIAIYSRKSKASDVGESIENQIIMCKEYALKLLNCNDSDFLIYEDEGFSGGNVKRPNFQRMLMDAKNAKFEILICYRLDRVSRNTGDFSTLINNLESYNISFVSIKEQFDTTTPMGKAMMYIASVFAQLERDTIAERIRDNLKQLAKTGRYLGGVVPLGFESKRIDLMDCNGDLRNLSKLIEIPEEIETVKLLYRKYIELDSLTKVVTYACQNDIKSKLNSRFNIQSLKYILTNTVYVTSNLDVYNYLKNNNFDMCGNIEEYNGCALMTSNRYKMIGDKRVKNTKSKLVVAPALHFGVIDSFAWLKVQENLKKNESRSFRKVRNGTALLVGLLKCGMCGDYMRPRIGRIDKNGDLKFYYMCQTKEISKKTKCSVKNINGNELDLRILKEVLNFYKDDFCLDKDILKNIFNEKDTLLKEISKLTKKILINENSVKTLIENLEKSTSELTTNLIFERIKKLEDENLNIQSKILIIESESSTENYDFIQDIVINFKSAVLYSDVSDKRKFIKSIITQITWDGESISYKI